MVWDEIKNQALTFGFTRDTNRHFWEKVLCLTHQSAPTSSLQGLCPWPLALCHFV